jgi:hypothetical protein
MLHQKSITTNCINANSSAFDLQRLHPIMTSLLRWYDSVEWCAFVSRVRRDFLNANNINHVSRERLIAIVQEHLPRHYSAVVAFHGCRPTDLNSYYRKGLLRQTNEIRLQIVDRVIELTGLPRSEVQQAVLLATSEVDAERSFVALDGRELVETSPHYLIYGSEFTMSVLARLAAMGHPNYQYRLKSFGIPTLLTCHVPTRLIPSYGIREIASTLVEYAIRWKYRARKESPLLDHSIVLHGDLPPESIVSHSHPNNLVDYHAGGMKYRWKP